MQVPGIGPEAVATLNAAGVTTTFQLLGMLLSFKDEVRPEKKNGHCLLIYVTLSYSSSCGLVCRLPVSVLFVTECTSTSCQVLHLATGVLFISRSLTCPSRTRPLSMCFVFACRYHHLRVLGIKSNRSTVVKALAEKLTLWIPGL
jgi:hypothetical protein